MKTASTIALAFVLAATFAVGAHAQMATDASTMPALYDASGNQMNTSSQTALPAGDYYLKSGSRVSYNGNGTYFDPSTGLYGGSVSNPSGTAGVALNYGSAGTASIGTPGVPNTGAGGQAASTWTALGLSGIIAVAGLAYLATRVVVR